MPVDINQTPAPRQHSDLDLANFLTSHASDFDPLEQLTTCPFRTCQDRSKETHCSTDCRPGLSTCAATPKISLKAIISRLWTRRGRWCIVESPSSTQLTKGPCFSASFPL